MLNPFKELSWTLAAGAVVEGGIMPYADSGGLTLIAT